MISDPLMLSFKGKKRIFSDHHVCILAGWALWIAPWVVFSVKTIRGVFYSVLGVVMLADGLDKNEGLGVVERWFR